jgi:hypothetical protein
MHLYSTPSIQTYYKDSINPNHVLNYASGESAIPENSLHLLHFQVLNHRSLCLLSLTTISFAQITYHSQHFCFESKVTCRYKQAKVTKGIKTIAVQLSVDSILFYLKLATSTYTIHLQTSKVQRLGSLEMQSSCVRMDSKIRLDLLPNS